MTHTQPYLLLAWSHIEARDVPAVQERGSTAARTAEYANLAGCLFRGSNSAHIGARPGALAAPSQSAAGANASRSPAGRPDRCARPWLRRTPGRRFSARP